MLRPALIVHGGAGAEHAALSAARRAGCAAAVDAAWQVLLHAGSAVDAVCEAVAAMENDATFNAGRGSCLTSNGTVEMDASIMDGRGLQAGAVAVARGVSNPVRLARAIMEDGRFVLLAGQEADAFARQHGLDTCAPEALVTESQRQRWRQQHDAAAGGTVGAAAVDRAGHVAAATSTGGIFDKLPGRVGDSALIGAGTYADDLRGAASATGQGEAIMRVVLAHYTVSMLHDGSDPTSAAQRGVRYLGDRTRGGLGGIIVVDPFGRLGYAYNTAHMTIGYMRPDCPRYVVQV